VLLLGNKLMNSTILTHESDICLKTIRKRKCPLSVCMAYFLVEYLILIWQSPQFLGNRPNLCEAEVRSLRLSPSNTISKSWLGPVPGSSSQRLSWTINYIDESSQERLRSALKCQYSYVDQHTNVFQRAYACDLQ
jgi:hypothetical protein